MAYIVEPDVIKYACTCGLLKPISRLYFCRYCLQLRCGFCVYHEVDSSFCGKCLENLPSSEARLKKNRCSNCLDCPSCGQQLSVRAGPSRKDPEDSKAAPKKLLYLLCFSCHWTSRDVGIPDQQAATGGWPERDNVHMVRLQEIMEYYKGVVLQEKQQLLDRDKKKQRKYMNFTDRTGITASMLRKRIGLSDSFAVKPKIKPILPAVASAEVEGLPEDIFTKPLNLCEVTTLEQRLLQPDFQPETVDLLYPPHKQLFVKRSLRCRACEHNVSKPEYGPISVKFKIQLFAYYHIPEVRLVTVEPLRAGKPAELLIKFTNPTQHQTTISFSELDLTAEEIVEENLIEETLQEEPIEIKETSLTSLPSLQHASLLHTSLMSKPPYRTIKPRKISQEITATLEIPTSSFILSPRDDAAEYDDTGDNHNIQDDSKLVVFRKSNKAVVRLQITPNADLKIGDPVVLAFNMHHIYTNTIATTVENKEPQKCDHKVKVFLELGKTVGSD